MANRAVLGAVALGVGLHKVNEWRKDQNVEMERKQHEQLYEDRRQAHIHREMEREKRQHHKKNNNNKKKGGSERELFARNLNLAIEKELNETIRTAGHLPTMKARQFEALKLPLLGKEPKSQDFKLAVALAFASYDCIEDLTSQASFNHRLGTPLVTLDRQSVQRIIQHIKSKKASRWLEVGVYELDQQAMNMCASLAIEFQNIHDKKPFVLPYKHKYSRAAAETARRYGFFLIPCEYYDSHYNSCFTFKHFDFRGKRYDDSFFLDGCEAFITNFKGNFKVSSMMTTEKSILVDFSSATTRKHGKRAVRIQPFNFERLTSDYGLMHAHEIQAIAVSRLEFLASKLSRGQELSLQHIAVYSGYEGTVLDDMESADNQIISENKSSLEVTLHSTLQACVPPTKIQTVVAHQAEIRHFVKSYLRLLQLSYCKIPLLAKGPPSDYVAKKSVEMEAREKSIWLSDATMFHGTRKLLEEAEREKIDKSRILTKPKFATVFLVGLSLFALLVWIVYLGVYNGVVRYLSQSTIGMERMASLIITVPFAYLMIQNLVLQVQEPLRVPQTGDDVSWNKTLEALTECIVRKGCIQMGLPTPFESELETLSHFCQQQHKEWSARIAIEEFERAHKRKKIGYTSYLLLMDALRETVYKTLDDAEVVDVSMPGSAGHTEYATINNKTGNTRHKKKNKEAQTSESPIHKKISKTTGGYGLPPTLSEATSILKPFICNDEEDSGPASKLSLFKSIETIAEAHLKFDIGDRVTVKQPNQDDATEMPPKFSSTVIVKLSTDLQEFKSLNGSIVSCHPGHCLIHFDGMPECFPVPIPLSWVSPLDESRVNNLLRNTFGDMVAVDNHAIVPLTETDDENASIDSSQTEETVEDTENESDESDSLSDQDRPATLEEALIQGKWTLARWKHHNVYKRTLVLPSDANEGRGGTKIQTVAFAKTSSDRRSEKNAMSTLNRQDEEKEALSAKILVL